MEYREFSSMSTTILLAAEGQPRRVQTGFQQAEELIQRYADQFTRFTDTSELAAVNRSCGEWITISQEMFEIIRLAKLFHQETGGLFNPGILVALETVGYDRTIAEVQSLGSSQAGSALLERTYQAPPFSQVEADKDRRAVRLPDGLTIDLGGIAKGWIAEQAARRLALYAQACAVNAGGDLYAIGRPDDSPAWPVAVEDPFQLGQDLAVLSVPQGAVATSSVTKRKWLQAGQKRHHLIDPRTGLPAETDWASVTVICNHAAKAEVLAKALLIAGSAGSQKLIQHNPEAAFLVVDRSGQLLGSENSRNYYHGYNG